MQRSNNPRGGESRPSTEDILIKVCGSRSASAFDATSQFGKAISADTKTLKQIGTELGIPFMGSRRSAKTLVLAT